MRRPRISGVRVWANHESRVLRIFTHAMDLLRTENNLDVCENALNRRLLFCVRTANDKFNRQGIGIEYPVTYEANNQPDAENKERAEREDKRPDFQWGFLDTSERDPLRQDKYFVVECKRLGEPVREDWLFNTNYVENGILRFVRTSHGYGKSTESGAMIGYIRSMDSAHILTEVNGHVGEAELDEIRLSADGWIARGVSRLDQTLNRPEVPPTPFSLRHLWVDFRQT